MYQFNNTRVQFRANKHTQATRYHRKRSARQRVDTHALTRV